MFRFFKKKSENTSDFADDVTKNVIFSVMRGGGRILKAVRADDLMKENAKLIFTLKLLLDLPETLQNELVNPLIARSAAMCGSIPASKGAHDPDAGGLFRHSLLVASNALSALKRDGTASSSDTSSDNIKLSILFAALSHDLLKVLCDVTVLSHEDKSKIWDPFLMTLDEFIVKYHCKNLELHYRDGRKKEHDSSPELRALLFFGGNFRLLSYLKQDVELGSLLNGTHQIWELVNGADVLSARMSGSVGSNVVNVPNFISADMYEHILQSPERVNRIGSELFVMPYGVVVMYGGSEWEALAKLSRSLFAKETRSAQGNFISSLKSEGAAKLFGTLRVFSWHRIEFQDAVIYIRGIVLRMDTEELLKMVPKADIMERGAFPPELSDKDLKDQNRLVIKDSPHPDCNSHALSEESSDAKEETEYNFKTSSLLPKSGKQNSCTKLLRDLPSTQELTELLRRRNKLNHS